MPYTSNRRIRYEKECGYFRPIVKDLWPTEKRDSLFDDMMQMSSIFYFAYNWYYLEFS